MQGLRRSGTTISFDVLSQDGRFDMMYEPFSVARAGAIGGGSGVQDVDVTARVHALRTRFAADHPELAGAIDLLNYGAPRDARLEMEPTMPAYCTDYLRHLAAQAPDTVFKFTRMYCKIGVLAEVDPSARVVLLLRHPKAVVASYLYGRGDARRRRYRTAHRFFGRTSDLDAWSSEQLLDAIAATTGDRRHVGAPDWKRILVLWRFCVEQALDGIHRHFPRSTLLLRHEDLAAAPAATVRALYDHIGTEPSSSAIDWAVQHVRLNAKPCHPSDPRWAEAFEELGVTAVLRRAGYDGDADRFLGSSP
jgi:hypothetical protein